MASLKSSLKEKETEVILVLQEINIMKAEVNDKDEFKVKYVDAHKTVGMN